MTDFIPQPYPLWLSECIPGHRATSPARVVAWRPNQAGSELRPMVVNYGGVSSPAAVEAFGPVAGSCFGYGETPERAQEKAYDAARRSEQVRQPVAADGDWPGPARPAGPTPDTDQESPR